MDGLVVQDALQRLAGRQSPSLDAVQLDRQVVGLAGPAGPIVGARQRRGAVVIIGEKGIAFITEKGNTRFG